MTEKPTTEQPDVIPEKDRKTGSPASRGPVPADKEIGGPAGPEPTRFGDWEQKGRCTDF